ncbi:MAG: hypothetical protein JKX70_00115 [Phycisphaerales bacterium]|nr:hypothetical protein [Phycisphaerales bacterium]
MRVELTQLGYLIVSAEIAAECFGDADAVIVALRNNELWLISIGQRAVGGLIFKQRNARGDRSVLVTEQIGNAPWDVGEREVHWDADERALRVPLSIENTADSL